LLMLLLLEGACAITPLPTKKVGIRGAGKSDTKWGSDMSVEFQCSFSLLHKDMGDFKTFEAMRI
jgi:hypothetical protein